MRLDDDPEYRRLRGLWETAKAGGYHDLIATYFRAVIKRGDELVVSVGGVPFMPLVDALDAVSAASAPD